MVISNGVGEMRWIMCEGKLPRSVTSFTHELFFSHSLKNCQLSAVERENCLVGSATGMRVASCPAILPSRSTGQL